MASLFDGAGLCQRNRQVIADIGDAGRLLRRLPQQLESTLGLGVELKLVEPRTIARSEGKARRVIDKRSL